MRLIVVAVCLLLCACSSRREGGGKKPSGIPGVDPTWSDGLDALFLYSYGFCIVMIAACVAVLFWVQVPSIRKWACIGLTFAGALIGMGITFSVMKPFIPWLVLGGVAIGVGLGVMFLVHNWQTLKGYVKLDKEDLPESQQKLIEACQTSSK